MNTRSIEITQNFLPLLREIGPAFTQNLLQRLLCEDPTLESVFDLEAVYSGRFPVELYKVIISYLRQQTDTQHREHIIEVVAAHDSVKRITPNQYTIIGHQLVETVKYFSGGELDKGYQEAWLATFWQFIDAVIARRAASNRDQEPA